MELVNFLEQKKAAIVKEWFEQTAETYPADAARFIKSQQNQFANPVGSLTHQSLEAVYDELVKGMDEETVSSFLDPVIRVRAIQSFSPAKSVAFIFNLKNVIYKVLEKELKNNEFGRELRAFEARIDQLALVAFDLYVQCREKIYNLKATEEKKRTFSAFERAGLIREMPEEGVRISEKIN